MSWTRLASVAVLGAAFATPVALDAPAPRPEHQPKRVRPGHARVQAPTAAPEPAAPVVLTGLELDAEPGATPADPDTVAAEPGETTRAIGGGLASYYGAELAGNATASGERFDPSALTAAHRTLPFGTRVEVTHARTGAAVTVRINDRGPFHGARVIDLSHEAARQIGLVRAGTGRVELAIVED